MINEAGKKWWYEVDQLVKASGKPKKKGTKKKSKKKAPTVAAAAPQENEAPDEVAKEGEDVLAGIS